MTARNKKITRRVSAGIAALAAAAAVSTVASLVAGPAPASAQGSAVLAVTLREPAVIRMLGAPAGNQMIPFERPTEFLEPLVVNETYVTIPAPQTVVAPDYSLYLEYQGLDSGVVYGVYLILDDDLGEPVVWIHAEHSETGEEVLGWRVVRVNRADNGRGEKIPADERGNEDLWSIDFPAPE